MINIELMHPGHVSDTVVLHCSAFRNFFLTSLGKKFLHVLYMEYCNDKNMCCTLVAHDGGQVVGFIVCVIEPKIFYKKILKKSWYKFFFALMIQLIKSPKLIVIILKKIRERLNSGEKFIVNGAELSSFAVLPELQGLGIGKMLNKRFIEEMHKRQVEAVYLTTDADNNDKVNQFYQNCGWKYHTSYVSCGSRKMNVYIKVID